MPCPGETPGSSEKYVLGTAFLRCQTPTKPQTFYQVAAVLWKNLAHLNIVSLLGVTTEPLGPRGKTFGARRLYAKV